MKAINWNNIEEPVDKQVWERLTSNFWLDTKVPVSNDLPAWRKMTKQEQEVVKKVFASLTLFDTLQQQEGAPAMRDVVTTPHAKAVFSNIEFMEAFSGDTELLTPGGWKRIKDVTENDSVCQYDPEANALSFTKPKVVEPFFSTEVYEVVGNNGNSRQVVSGGHRVYVEEKVKKNNQCQDWAYEVYEARELKDVNMSAHRRFRNAAPTSVDTRGMSAVDRLLVAINADGSFKAGSSPRYTGEKTGTIPAHFTFHKQRKIDRLHELAAEAGWKLTERKASNETRRHFVLHVPLEYVPSDRSNAFINWWSLDEISADWAREFVLENGLWDGHKHKKGHGVTFYTTNKEDSDFFVAVSTLAGYKSRTVAREDARSETFSDLYVTYTSLSKDTTSAQTIRVEQAEPQTVYCVQVPTTFLLTRNGECPVISGNCVHAKSYSTIFSTLCSSREIDELFRWAEEDDLLQKQANVILQDYKTGGVYALIAGVLLESFLFYSGFYAPLRLASEGRLTNTADIIRLIMRDEGVHGYYAGYWLQKLDPNGETREYAQMFVQELLETELERSEQLYDKVGWTEDVKHYLRYNANKALANLGIEPLFPREQTKIPAYILSALDPGTGEAHDFFSGSGASYVIGKREETQDDDWL